MEISSVHTLTHICLNFRILSSVFIFIYIFFLSSFLSFWLSGSFVQWERTRENGFLKSLVSQQILLRLVKWIKWRINLTKKNETAATTTAKLLYYILKWSTQFWFWFFLSKCFTFFSSSFSSKNMSTMWYGMVYKLNMLIVAVAAIIYILDRVFLCDNFFFDFIYYKIQFLRAVRWIAFVLCLCIFHRYNTYTSVSSYYYFSSSLFFIIWMRIVYWRLYNDDWTMKFNTFQEKRIYTFWTKGIEFLIILYFDGREVHVVVGTYNGTLNMPIWNSQANRKLHLSCGTYMST